MADIMGTKSEGEIRRAIKELKRSCLETEGLKARMDDKFLLRFLVARKFDQKRAFKLLKSYYSARKGYPNVFTNFVPSAMKDILEIGIFEVLPQSDKLQSTVVIGRSHKWDVSVYSVIDVIRGLSLILEAVLEDDSLLNNGITFIFDFSGITWQHCWQFSPSVIYLIQLLFEDTFPARVKAWHIVNMHIIAKGLITLFMTLVKSKLRKKIHLHGTSMDKLYQYFPKDCLPVEYGGHLEAYDTASFVRTTLELEEIFQTHEECWSKSAAKN